MPGKKPKKSPLLSSAERRQKSALSELALLKKTGVARKGQISRAQKRVDEAAEALRSIRRARGR